MDMPPIMIQRAGALGAYRGGVEEARLRQRPFHHCKIGQNTLDYYALASLRVIHGDIRRG
jgi:hypothetical protein